ncbi:MAG: hypothetical protein PWP32_1561 [Methanothermobacter sp.]|mgnify:CR=1 FL=1|nr:hypothetical protein [Methanothermobacter sp.]
MIRIGNEMYRLLKSDQNGIEIKGGEGLLHPCPELKSDQNGIEIHSRIYDCIAPTVLKSDQNGIEMRVP